MEPREKIHAKVPAVLTIIAFASYIETSMHWKRQINKILNYYEKNLIHGPPWKFSGTPPKDSQTTLWE